MSEAYKVQIKLIFVNKVKVNSAFDYFSHFPWKSHSATYMSDVYECYSDQIGVLTVK